MTVASHTPHTAPDLVHGILREHMLTDGFSVVLDLRRSRGSVLFDARNDLEIIDLFTCFSTCPLGYNHPKLADPDFLEELTLAAVNKPSNSDLYTTQMADFVEALARTLPEPFRRRMFFIEGGALAVENALKTAFDWKVRKNLAAGRGELGSRAIHLREAFHGRSGYTLSLTNTDPRKTQYFPKFDWPRIVNPKLSFPVTDEVLERVVHEEEEAVAQIESAVREHPHDIACLILEPIQGEGGDNHFRAEFLRRLRRLADEHDFLLIFDEVQTGFGTTGRWWCFEHFGVEPDIFAFGKKAQVCGICATERVDEVDSVFKVSSRINSTWGGNLADMIRCRRFVEIIEEDDLLANATRMGAYLLEGVRGLADTFSGRVTNARGRGMFIAFDLSDGETRDRTWRALREHGVLALKCGRRSIRFRPALSLSAERADQALHRAEQALATVV